MKKGLIAIAMMLALSMSADGAAQRHRHTPRKEQVDTTRQEQEAIEAYSDTTSSDTANYSGGSQMPRQRTITITDEDAKVVQELFEGMGSFVGPGIVAIVAIVVLFLLAPLLIIITIFYFVNRNRRERYRLAQMAIQNGQPVPDDILRNQLASDSDDYRAGIRQMCLGVGLAIFLGIIMDEVGFGIGALVFCIGLGKWYIARQSRGNGNGTASGSDFNNNSNIQNYD